MMIYLEAAIMLTIGIAMYVRDRRKKARLGTAAKIRPRTPEPTPRELHIIQATDLYLALRGK